MNLSVYPKKNGVYYISKNQNHFSDTYIAVRKKENRVLTDEQVKNLPNCSKEDPNYHEWQLREKTTNRFINYLQQKNKNLMILDVGCGNGWFSNKMAQVNDANVIALDINELELEQASRVFNPNKNLNFCYVNIFEKNLSFIEKFDMIVLNASVQYFKDFLQLVQRLKLFLKPNGEIHILDSPFYEESNLNKAKKRTKQYYINLGYPKMAENYYHHSVANLKDFSVLYQPKKMVLAKFFQKPESPFIWLKYSKIKEDNWQSINKGFSEISHQYENLNQYENLTSWMRKRVRNHLEKELKPQSKILEINCGTGIDAVYFAQKKHQVLATDLAEGMLTYVKNKIRLQKLDDKLTCKRLSFTQLETLKPQKFDCIFSNFGGLNCMDKNELQKVFNSFNSLLNDKGKISLVIMPKICLWEFLRVFKLDKSAFRRLKKNGVLANIEGEKVRTYYYTASTIQKMLVANFTNFKIENICFLAPTGNKYDFPNKYPKLFQFLMQFDKISNKIPFLKGYGDYFVLTAQKK